MKKKAINFFKEYYPYFLAVAAIVFPWFFKGGFLFFTDFVLGPNLDLFWWDNWFLPNLIFTALSKIIPFGIIEKFFIALMFFILLMGGKKIAENFLKDKWPVFSVSLFALFNPFIYDRVGYGQFGVILSAGFMLIAIGYLLKYLFSEKGENNIVKSAPFIGLMILFSMHFIFIFGLFVMFLLVLLIIKKRYHFMLLKMAAISILIIVGINFNWLAAAMAGSSPNFGYVKSGITVHDLYFFKTAGDNKWDALKNVIMLSGFWGKDQFRYADLTDFKQNWGISYVILLPFVFYGIYQGFRQRKYKGLVAVLLAAFIAASALGVGIRFPAAREMTFWLFEKVPFYKGMRETQKWAVLLIPIYMVFISLGIKYLFEFKPVILAKNIFVIFIGAVMVLQAPLLVWGYGGQLSPVEYPQDWYEMEDIIVKDGGCKKSVLFLPWHMYMFFGYAGRVINNPAKAFFSCRIVSGTNMEVMDFYDNSQTLEGELVPKWLNSKGESGLLSNADLNIGYVIVAKELNWEDLSWIKDLSGIEVIKETNNLILYKNNSYETH